MQFFTCINALAAAAVLLLVNVTPVASRTPNNAIAGQYIVLLKPNTTASIEAHYNKVRSIHARNLRRRDSQNSSAGIEHIYKFGDFQGYAGSFDNSTIKELKALPEVLSVEPDYTVKLSSIVAQFPAPWNLALLSCATWSRSWASRRNRYAYDSSAGEGTFSYVLDSGIRLDHREFVSRAIFGFNAVKGSTNNADEVGHGTHVAGIIGGTTYGVAKKTTLVAVKVGGASDPVLSDILKGFFWAVNDIVRRGRQMTAVINVSSSTVWPSESWDRAITWAASTHGVLVVTSAGNSNKDAADVTPCRSPETICVGEVQNRLRVSRTSNYGPAVNIYAPGTDIVSADFMSNTGVKTLSGTSMAAPQVAGLVSYLRGLEGPSTAAAITARVYALARKGVVRGTRGGNKWLAYNGAS